MLYRSVVASTPLLLALAPTSSPDLAALAPDTRAVARAMALWWTWRPRSAIHQLLPQLGARTARGTVFTQEAVKEAQQDLRRRGWVVDEPGRQGYIRLRDDVRAALYRELLQDTPVPALRSALHGALGFDPSRQTYGWPIWERAPSAAVVRLECMAGTPRPALDAMRQRVATVHDWFDVVNEACLQAFDPLVFERIEGTYRFDLAYVAVQAVCSAWRADLLPVAAWALERVSGNPALAPEHLRLQLAEWALHRGDEARVATLTEGIDGGAADALRAACLVHAGRWPEAQAAFEVALKKRQSETGARKRVFPILLAFQYPLALLARQATKELELARKFCLGEAGSRTPPIGDGWGLWVHAVTVRLGDAELVGDTFELRSRATGFVDPNDLWRCLLRAWLGADACRKATPKGPHALARRDAAAPLLAALRGCQLFWLESQVIAAEAAFRGAEPGAAFFVTGRQEAWREALTLLESLGHEAAGPKARRATRLVWSLELDRQGRVVAIEPMEQQGGVRGWNKPKPVSLAKLAGNTRLDPQDARVLQAARKEHGGARRYTLDRAAAIDALIGHPLVILAEAPETTIDVVAGVPELEVVRDGDRFVMRMRPLPHADVPADEHRYFVTDEDRREAEALRQIVVVRDSSQRVRVIRLTPAQRRAAQLIAERLAVPVSGEAELQRALNALAGHFQVQSDHAEAAREVAAEVRLHAELSPVGDHLLLRLVVAPLGAAGPRLMPGAGRARVMAAVGGETVGAVRDLATERAHLDAVLAALPFLDPPGAHDVVCEWVIDDPERALGAVEVLPTLPAVAAVDWPRGQPVRVVTVDHTRLAVHVRSERDWFRIDGRATLDESTVIELEALLAGARGGRFVPMGKGIYAALTRDLRARLAELAAVAEHTRDGMRVPALASAWLDEVLTGIPADVDSAYRERIDRLRRAQGSEPALPPGLLAELRPYQEDGYAWAMRLAGAGFGACLADDMGLGKTIQALAVLSARAAGGPALVVAPTSVCGNWAAETRRFAPQLNALVYGEGDRVQGIGAAGARDVLIVSYTLLQQAQAEFAARRWHTVVADEAQAIKNAAAKRSLALFELDGDFRLAMSGTPVENRLAELWSIMRFCNPGLLGPLARFNERFAGPIERGRDRDAQRMLRRLVGPFILRRTKAEVLSDLPARTELVITVTADRGEAEHYEALRRQAVAVADSVSTTNAGEARIHILAQLTRLRRAACDPRLVNPEFALVGGKVRAFAELATELVANGHKALVFSQFVDFLTLLRAPLDEAGIRYQYLDGATPAAERNRRVDAFQAGEGDLFLISLKAGGFGLNLTAADYVVIADPWWNPAAEDQAMGRAHRIGQQRPVTVYRLVARGTLEERIVELHHDKRALAEGLLAAGDEPAALPSADELIALLRGE